MLAQQFAAKMVKPETTSQEGKDDEYSLPQIPIEEIEKMTLQEDLSEADRIKILLTKKDQPSQQAYVFHNAVNIFKNNPDQIQQAIIPIILKQMGTFSEKIQAEAGQAFTQLLNQQILEPFFFRELKNTCQVMLRQWSKQILEQWIHVYTCLIPQMLSSGDFSQKLKDECLENCLKMSEAHQPISVRLQSTLFIAQIAEKSIISPEEFEAQIFPRVTELCHDRNWEVHSHMTKNLKYVSKYLGPDKTEKLVFPLLIELLNHQEGEVQRKAITTLIKLAVNGLIRESFIQTEEFKNVFKKILEISCSSGCSLQLRNSIVAKLGDLIVKLDVERYGNDSFIEESLLRFIKDGRKSEFIRLNLPQFLSKLSHLYTINGKFCHFYSESIQEYINNEISSQGMTKDIKKAIASQLSVFITSALQISLDHTQTQWGLLTAKDLINKFNYMLNIPNKEILNELVSSAFSIFDFIKNHQAKVCVELQKLVHEKIKDPLFTQVDNILIQNWRYHLNYFEKFLSKYIMIADKDEATMIIFPLMLKGASDPRCSMPVKKFLAEFCADIIYKQANMYLRLSIQESIIKDFGQSDSSQLRQIFMFFLEHLIPHISKTYFKSVFMEPYLVIGEKDQVTSILMSYVKLAPEVRKKVDDLRTIERIDKSLQHIKSKKKCQDLQQMTDQAMAKISDPKFIQEIQLYQCTTERQLVENEHHLRDIEISDKIDQNPQKKKRMELFIQTLVGEGFKKDIRIVSAGNSTPQEVNKAPLTQLGKFYNMQNGSKTPGLPPQRHESTSQRDSSSNRSRNGAGIASNSQQQISKQSGFKPVTSLKK